MVGGVSLLGVGLWHPISLLSPSPPSPPLIFSNCQKFRKEKTFHQGRLTDSPWSVINLYHKGLSMARSPITRDGYNHLHKELENMKKVIRPQAIKAIEEARAHGDIRENAGVVAAKEQQSFVE